MSFKMRISNEEIIIRAGDTTVAKGGQGPSAESRAPNQPFLGRPNYEIDLILGAFYLT